MPRHTHKNPHQQALELVDQAKRAGRKHDFAGAVSFGGQAGRKFLEAGDFAAAGKQLEISAHQADRKLKDKGKAAELEELSGEAYGKAGKPVESGDRLRVAASIRAAHLKDFPTAACLHERAGEAYFTGGGYEAALDEFDLAASTCGANLDDPNRALDNRIRYGDCLVKLGRIGEAAELFLTEVKLLHLRKPLDIDRMIVLDEKSGDTFLLAGEFEKAGNSFTACSKNLSAHKGDHDRAVAVDEKAGNAYLRAGLQEKAGERCRLHEKAGERYKFAGSISRKFCTVRHNTLGFFCRAASAYNTAGNSEEESFCCWQASEVAKALGKAELAEKYAQRDRAARQK